MERHWYDRVLRRLLPQTVYSQYDQKFRSVNFTEAQLVRILYTVRSEQQRETALYMVLKELEKYNVIIK